MPRVVLVVDTRCIVKMHRQNCTRLVYVHLSSRRVQKWTVATDFNGGNKLPYNIPYSGGEIVLYCIVFAARAEP